MAHQIEREQRLEVAEVLRELLAVVNSHRNLQAVLDFVLERAVDLLGGDAGLIYMANPEEADAEFLHIAATRGLSADRVAPRLRIGSPISGMAFQLRRAVAWHDLARVLEDERGPDAEPVLEDRNSHLVVRSIGNLLSETSALTSLGRMASTHPAGLAVPLLARDAAYGSLALFYTKPREFSDDVVDLVGAFADQAALVIENTQLHRQSEQRAEELELLHLADDLLHHSLRLQDVLQALCDIGATALHADKAVVWMLDEARTRIRVGAGHAISPTFRADVLSVEEAATQIGPIYTGDVAVMEDVVTDIRVSDRQRLRDLQEGVRAWLAAKIVTGNQLFGSLAAGYSAPRTFNERDRRMVLALAQRAALAIQNARLFERSQQAATLEERQRLARELHDSVTQALYAISIYTDTADRALTNGNTESAATNLRDAGEATQEALAEMRLLIYELRPPLLEEFGLAAALRARLHAVESRAGLVAEFDADENDRLPADMEQELYRIAQEALNNVLKHAHAQRVQIQLTVNANGAVLQVTDDGVGFDPETQATGGLGLRGMRERAARLQGELHIGSNPGGGTRIRIQIPR